MIFNIVCFALSIFFFFYFILMQILSPEPFFRIFVSFSTVWLLLSVVFALSPFFRKKNFFKKFSKKLKIGFLSFCALCLVICSVHLVQILTPKHLDENSQVKYVILLGGGITKDCKIYIRKVAPLGDPVEITVRGYELSVRKDDASCVEIC